SLFGVLLKIKLLNTRYFVGRESTSSFLRYSGVKLSFYKILYVLGYKQLDLLVCQTDLMKDQLNRGMPKFFNKLNVQVIPNPINLELVNISGSNPDFEFNNIKYIVAAGRLIPEKGFDLLIMAFSKILLNYPALQLVIIGEGYLRPEL